jgi:predicted dehydrogenase
MAKIGVALVGTGFGQQVHLPALQAHHRTEVVAVYHRDRTQAQAIADTHGISQIATTIEAIVALPEVQAVSLSTPPFLHYEMAQTALRAGKPVLLEKPVTLIAAEAKHLYALAQAQSLPVTVDFEFRFVPAWQRLAELLQEDYVGQLRYVKIDWLGASRANPARPWNWYARQDQGGGTLGSIGSHSFDYIAWLLGPVRRLWASLSTTIPARPDPNTGELKPVTSDDVCNITLELQDGTPVQVCLSAVTMQGRGHFIEIYGDQGTLVLGNRSQTDYINGFTLQGSQNGQALVELEIPQRLQFPRLFPDGRIAPVVRVVDQWVSAIDQGQNLVPSLREGVYSQLLLDACHQSHASGTWVEIPDLATFLGES